MWYRGLISSVATVDIRYLFVQDNNEVLRLEQWAMEGAIIGLIIGALFGLTGDSLINLIDSLINRSRTPALTEDFPSSEAEQSKSRLEEQGATETTTEPPTEAIQFTHPHEEPESTYWEEEKDPVKRRKKQQKEREETKKRQKWLNSLSEEDRLAETNRMMNIGSIQDEYIGIMRDRPDFMRRIDEQTRAESKAGGTHWEDDWIVSKVSEGDLRTMSAAERTQYDQWVKRYDSFTRRHGSNRGTLRSADGRYNRKEFGSGGTRG
jgi:hypothetical protein